MVISPRNKRYWMGCIVALWLSGRNYHLVNSVVYWIHKLKNITEGSSPCVNMLDFLGTRFVATRLPGLTSRHGFVHGLGSRQWGVSLGSGDGILTSSFLADASKKPVPRWKLSTVSEIRFGKALRFFGRTHKMVESYEICFNRMFGWLFYTLW